MTGIIDLVDRIKTVVTKGIKTRCTKKLRLESEVFYQWFMRCSNLPLTCSANIFANEQDESPNIDFDDEPEAIYVSATFELNGIPIIEWYFDHDGLVFCPILIDSDDFEDWVSYFLYDLRLLSAIVILLEILQEIGDVDI